MPELTKILSVRLSEQDYEWLRKQGDTSDYLRLLVQNLRKYGGLTQAEIKMLKTLLSAIESVDEKAKHILDKI